ncbi:helix-turn-helix transcriptional regulator [Flaviflexus massiliensis]|uniref:helix-turn-helix transcriptional regulator n=1 Tax=Flaviflexus massiliensis TaxID=1522309 RepID=UPI0006D52C26|nr:helix-turn-helix transcriptional regulator [Flaviflexus massiliensis]
MSDAMRGRRRELKLTQAELAKDVGVSRQTIIAIEGGDYAPSVFLALDIGKRLGMTVEELFGKHD